MERNEQKDWVSKCMYMEVEGARPRMRPRSNWLEVVKNDMKGLDLASVDTEIVGDMVNPGLPGAPWDSSNAG